MSLAQRSTATVEHAAPEQIRGRRKTMPKIKPSVVAVYVSIFAVVIMMVSIGYHEPKNATIVANAASADTSSKPDQTSVNDVVATSVAAGVAQSSNLPIAISVANLAVSAQTKSDFAQSSSVNTTKPQIIETTTNNRAVTSYTAKAGDTVGALATKYNISAQTIKWSNNLTSDAIEEGKVLKILPVDGVLYDVKANDTIDSIATKYGVDKTRLTLYNDLDVSGLVSNTTIILPSANLPENERPGYVTPAPAVIATTVTSTNYYAGSGAGFGGNTWRIGVGTSDGPYAHGNCTLYAYNRRVALGLPAGSNWGNASSWAYNAQKDGLLVNNTPSVGAVMQNGGGYGHVAIVESILPNGDVSISEMNAYVSGGGYNIVSGRIVSAGNASQYLYIH